MKFIDALTELKNRVIQFMEKTVGGNVAPTLPVAVEDPEDEEAKTKQDKIVDFVKALHEEAESAWKNEWTETKTIRTAAGTAVTPEQFYTNCDQLEAGNVWEVFGRRNVNQGEEWKQEITDGEIGRQMRARASYLTGSWHEVSIMPNVANFEHIFQQEREQNEWGTFIRQYVKSAQKYGEATCQVILDKTKDPNGIVRPTVLKRNSFFRTPFSTSFSKFDGCWYIVKVGTINDKQIAETYDIDMSDLASANLGRDKKFKDMPVLNQTKIYDKLEVYCDDPMIEKVPFTPEEQAQVIEEDKQLLEGTFVQIGDMDNHVEHLKLHTDALHNLMDIKPETPEEEARMMVTVEAYQAHIADHTEKATTDELAPRGLRKKYPHGRYIVVVGNKVAVDIPNPYEVEWRSLFRTVKNEDVVNRSYGRGDPEALYHVEKNKSTMLSRIADIALTTGMTQKWLHENDRGTVQQDGDSNDPTKIHFYSVEPPVPFQGHPPGELLQLYQTFEGKGQETLGVSDVTFGKTPTSQSSNALAETLLHQNEQIITGELNYNLIDALKDIIETMIELYKNFYREPRQYFINGQNEEIVLSDVLTFQMVEVDGQMVKKTIPKFEIKIKPMSNLPNKWENNVALLTDIAGNETIPEEVRYGAGLLMVDVLSERYPELGKNGKYYQMGKATAIGMQMLAQQQEQEEMKAKSLKSVQNQFIREKIKDKIMPENGKTEKKENKNE